MNYPRILIAMLMSGLSIQAIAAVQASLDRNQIEQSDTVRLTLQQNGSSRGEPDLTPLKRDFDILGTSQGSNIQIVNGSMSQQAQVQVTLSPKHDGKINIPPLQWGSDHTQALVLNVDNATGTTSTAGQSNTSASTSATSNNAHVFFKTTLNEKQPYVQGTVVLTLKLYTDEQLYQASLDLAANNDILVQQLGKDEQHSENLNGHNYLVIQRQYLLTPQRSGQLNLDGPILNAQVADTDDNDIFGSMPFGVMANSARPLRLHGNPIILNVRKHPVDSNGHDLLPAQQLTLKESWKPDLTTISTGEPLTRHLHLSAIGVMGNALPDLSSLMSLPEGIKAYPDQAKTDTNTQNGNVVGSSDQDIALIANKPGHYVLPAIKFAWWDATQNVQREETLPARTIDVTGAAINTTASSPVSATTNLPTLPVSSPEKTPSIWRWISIIFMGLWILTLGAWWWDHKRLRKQTPKVLKKSKSPSAVPNAGNAMKAFQQACHANEAVAARQHLLLWAAGKWPQNPPTGLSAIAEKFADAHIKQLLEQLDRACYVGGEWFGAPLAQALTTLPKITKAQKKRSKLDDLYQD